MTSRKQRRQGAWAAFQAAIFGLALTAFPAMAADTAPAPVDPFVQVKAMQRGINVLGYDPLWKDRSKARFRDRHFDKIKAAGFNTLRVNLAAFAHMDKDNRLDPKWFETLDWIVKSGTDRGLTVIIDEHNYNECGKDAASCRPRLLAFWKQVGEHYRDAPSSVIFELLNEPNGQLTDEAWNGLMADTLAVVRQTNPTRNVVVGPAFWNNINHLQHLKLPAGDRHLIVTVHYYLPMEFTHQGAPWNEQTKDVTGVRWGTDAERASLEKDLDMVQQWSKANNRPILMGEFGAYDKGDMASRVAYTTAVARGAEARNWAWAYWQFDSDFLAYDMAKDDWVEPILAALVPPLAAN
jgi:endoglucanase